MDDTPPLPLRPGDTRVPEVLWEYMTFPDGTSRCWIWEGNVSPSGNAVWRRKSVWRLLYSKLCGGDVGDLPRGLKPKCSVDLCVNPDHRVDPQDRPPVFKCPTCGAPTSQRLDPSGLLPPQPERSRPTYRKVRQRSGQEEPPPTRKLTRAEALHGLKITRQPIDLGMPTGRWCAAPDPRDVKMVEVQHGVVLAWTSLTNEQKKAYIALPNKIEVASFEDEINSVMGEFD